MLDRFIQDVKTYNVMIRNDNYRARLLEAYNYLKNEGVRSLEDFNNRDGLLVGAFTYDEITIFDRIGDPEYSKKLIGAYDTITVGVASYVNNPNIGDELASWGKLGETPKREEYIEKGYIIEGLTEEEAARHFK